MNCLANEAATDLGCIPTDPAGFVSKFYGLGLGMLGSIGVIFLIYGGYQIISSKGDIRQLENGKRTVIYTLGSLGLAIGAAFVLQLFTVDILHIPGFSH